MPRIGRKIVIAGITGLALAAGIGVVSAQASPSTAVATPAPTPDNITSVTAEIGVAWADAGDVSYVAKGRNIQGTSVSYDFSAVNDEPGSTGRPCPVDITLSGDTGDTVSLYDQDPQAKGHDRGLGVSF